MSRYGKMGKYKHRSGGPPRDSVIGTVRPAAPKELTQVQQERQAALRGQPGYVTYEDFIADCRNHIDDPVGAGTGLSSHFTVNEDPRMVTSSGCHDRIFD